MILLKKLYPNAIIPGYAHEHDAGMDLYAQWFAVLPVGEIVIVPIGIALEIQPEYCGLIRPRSGIATQYGITTVSSGVIDSNYRGEIHVGLINLGKDPYYINKGDRIAQLLIIPIYRPIITVVEELSDSERGVLGHGSTGK